MAVRSPEECILLWRAPVSKAPGMETGADDCRLPELEAASSGLACRRELPDEGFGRLLVSRECLLLAACCCVRAKASCAGATCHLSSIAGKTEVQALASLFTDNLLAASKIW